MILSQVAAKVTNSAIFGFGSSAGRDSWKSFKKNFFLLVVTLALIGLVTFPFLAFKSFVQGYPDAEIDEQTAGKNTGYLHLIGFVFCAIFCLFVIWLLNDQNSSALAWGQIRPVYIGMFCIFCISSLCGYFVGKLVRPRRMARFAIMARNDQFMNENGLSETGEQEITHYDSEGTGLRFMEQTEQRIVFMAVGRRNKRAYIQLSEEGEMLSYSGVVSLSGN